LVLLHLLFSLNISKFYYVKWVLFLSKKCSTWKVTYKEVLTQNFLFGRYGLFLLKSPHILCVIYTPVLKIHVQNVQWCTLKFWFSILKLLDLHDIFPFLYNFAYRFWFRFYTLIHTYIIVRELYAKYTYIMCDIYTYIIICELYAKYTYCYVWYIHIYYYLWIICEIYTHCWYYILLLYLLFTISLFIIKTILFCFKNIKNTNTLYF